MPESWIPKDFPKGWNYASIGSVCQKARLRDPSKTPDAEFEYVDVSSVSNESFGITTSTTTLGAAAPSRARKAIEAGDVLYATVRPYLKRVAMVPEQLNGQIASTGFCVVRADRKKAEPGFLYYLLLTDQLNNRIKDLQRGATYPAVSDKEVLNQMVPLPPLPEQRSIAAVLSKIQEAIAAQKEIIDRTRELKKALMARLFTEGLRGEKTKETEIGLVAESWEIRKIGDKAKLSSGGTPSRTCKEYWEDGTIPWVKTGEIDYKVIVETEEHITPLGMKNSAAKLFPKGTLLMAMYGQGITRGKVAILGIDATTNQACAAIFPDDDVDTEYLYYYLAFSYDRLRSLSHGAQQKNQIVASFKFAYPNIPEQKEIASILKQIDTKLDLAEGRLRLLDDLFKTMLHELMTGRIPTTPLMEV